MTHRYYRHTNSPDAVLAYAHYSDPAFDREACIYGAKAPGLQWDYDDRLAQWDYEKHKAAWAHAVAACGEQRTARRLEVYLSAYHGRPVRLRCVLAGTRPFDGYAWHAYGYEFAEEAPDADR